MQLANQKDQMRLIKYFFVRNYESEIIRLLERK